MPSEIPRDAWRGLDEVFNGMTDHPENYPAPVTYGRIPGIHVPDRWGHFRKRNKFAVVNRVFYQIEKQLARERLADLDKLYPMEYQPAKQTTPAQKIAFCFYYHNYEGLNRAVGQLIDEAVADAVAEYQPRRRRPGRPVTKRSYRRNLTLFSLADVEDMI